MNFYHHNFRDYNDFLEDIEEDPAFRQNINVYKGMSHHFSVVFSYSYVLDVAYFDVNYAP